MIRRVPWTQQPQIRLGLNTASPFARNVRVLISGARPGINLVDGKPLTVTGGASQRGTTQGIAQSFNGTSQALSMPLDLSNTNGVTVLSVMVLDSLSASFGMFWELTADSGANPGAFSAYYDAGTAKVNIATSGSSGANFNLFAPPSTAAPIVLATTHDQSLGTSAWSSMHINGQRQSGTTALSGTAAGVFANSTLYIGARTASTLWANFSPALFALLDRALSDVEHAYLAANPWQLLAPMARQFPGSANADVFYPIFYIRA
jgi:hypothetical protein